MDRNLPYHEIDAVPFATSFFPLMVRLIRSKQGEIAINSFLSRSRDRIGTAASSQREVGQPPSDKGVRSASCLLLGALESVIDYLFIPRKIVRVCV